MSDVDVKSVKRRQMLEAKYIVCEALSEQETAELANLQKEPLRVIVGKDGLTVDTASRDINRIYFLAEKLSTQGSLVDVEWGEYKALIQRYEGRSSFPTEIRALNALFGIREGLCHS